MSPQVWHTLHTALKGYKKSKFHFLFLASEWTLDHKNKV